MTRWKTKASAVINQGFIIIKLLSFKFVDRNDDDGSSEDFKPNQHLDNLYCFISITIYNSQADKCYQKACKSIRFVE